ncbi:MAG: DUF87 domain-containing protein [Lachnospiraceae bacterium]|nr:DUF87 domain-containing protein [Lachnospiraceae bacterium]
MADIVEEDTLILRPDNDKEDSGISKNDIKKSNVDIAKSQSELLDNLDEATSLIDDVVLKRYLYNLSDLEVVPLPDNMKDIGSIRLFKITEMVYQKKEYSTYKLASVLSSLQSLDCGVFILLDSNGEKTDFYMGIRNLDTNNKVSPQSIKETVLNSLKGEFPGVKTEDLLEEDESKVLQKLPTKNVAAVSGIAGNKDDEFKNNEEFIQGLEKLALAMQGQKYSLVVLAKSTSENDIDKVRKSYETIYTQLSPFSNIQLSYGQNTALTISDSFSNGITKGTSHQKGTSYSKGESKQKGTSDTHGTTSPDMKTRVVKTLGSAALGAAALATAPLTGGTSIAAAAAIAIGNSVINTIPEVTRNESSTVSSANTKSENRGKSESWGENESQQHTNTHAQNNTEGNSKTVQLSKQNKTIQDMMKRIDNQLKRLDECESLGMWECAAYALADTQETAEMVAGTYKALMNGEQSGVETSAINFWGQRKDKEKTKLLSEYIKNFIHPVFIQQSGNIQVPVSAATLVSSNELAIQMGLPRKSVCGFPVIEHADFGKEVVKYSARNKHKKFSLGKVYSMGDVTNMDVRLDRDSLTMHTFITGSTGSGKSNTVYEILDQLRIRFGTHFMVIEPAKGEYKNVFGQFENVSVYGTNPRFTNLLRINPFSFPEDIHVLEHIDRLTELFNVCWPMYAAMPAILKDSIERAYIASGWDMDLSENPKGRIYPNFADVLNQISTVVHESEYSDDSKGDYAGALLTRVRSLTTGLNEKIFSGDEIGDEKLFNKNVIVDLSRVGSSETKSLIMSLLVMKLSEYRMTSGKINSPLNHITVLEEAHNILKRTSTEQATESANITGKAVEMLSNSIAEMRTYGEGFIIADQAPGLLDMSAIRNTNTKIILRLPEKSDRELVGYSAGLNDEQIDELAKLKQGVAAVYQNDWVEPVLVQIHKCDIKEKTYNLSDNEKSVSISEIKTELFNFMLQGRVKEKLDFDVDKIKLHLGELGLSSSNTDFFENLIDEYKKTGKLSFWDDLNFRSLSKKIVDTLNVRNQVENSVINAQNNEELTEMLTRIVDQYLPNLDHTVKLVVDQCFLKDLASVRENREQRNKIYKNWVDDINFK